jgi:hypothetical protein
LGLITEWCGHDFKQTSESGEASDIAQEEIARLDRLNGLPPEISKTGNVGTGV